MATILLGLTLTTIVFFTPRGCNGGNVLLSPDSLKEGGYLQSLDFKLVMEAECNLVLYDAGRAVWTSNTARGKNLGCFARLQSDGNFVVYTKKWEVVWSSKSWQGGEAHYALVVQPNRDVVIYGPDIWHAHTAVPPPHEQHYSTSIATTTTGENRKIGG